MCPERPDVTDDAILGGRLRILQPRVGHRVGHDAILLAAATASVAGDRAVYLGAGVGAAGLALAARVAGVSVTLVDIDGELVALAADNAVRNGLEDRVSAIARDVAAPRLDLPQLSLADHVLMNPPFNDPTRQQASPDPRRQLAHSAPRETLGVWVNAAERILRPGGILTLIFAAQGIADVFAAIGDEFGAVAILPIHPKPAASAVRILVRAIKGSRAPAELRPGLVLNTAEGHPSADAEAILRGAAALPFDRSG